MGPLAAGSTVNPAVPEAGVVSGDRTLEEPEMVSADPEPALPSGTSPRATIMAAERFGLGRWQSAPGQAMAFTAAKGRSRGSSLNSAGEISCDRPGCYDLFLRTRRSPAQHFCGKPCRRAMERVWQREARWAERHGVRSSWPARPRARDGPEVLNRM